MNVIIVEDEVTALKKLEELLLKVDPSIKIVARLESVEGSVDWIVKNPTPDLGFFDIQLSDDSSFELFKQVKIDFPVVFVTAYDDYIMEAFDYNSIHYLLKPVTEEGVRKALEKNRQLKEYFLDKKIQRLLSGTAIKNAKGRLIVRKGLDFFPIDTDDIAYIYTEHKISFIRNWDNQTYIIDEPLTSLQAKLDPTRFFRVNRQYIVNVRAIKKFTSLEQSRIRLELDPASSEEVIIGKENAVAFRKWIRNEHSSG